MTTNQLKKPRTKKEDLVYYDKEYHIYKKDSGQLGEFGPIIMYDLINIGINGLEEWHNGGCKYVKDYESIIVGLISRLTDTISYQEIEPQTGAQQK